jgi:hypothetical protein
MTQALYGHMNNKKKGDYFLVSVLKMETTKTFHFSYTPSTSPLYVVSLAIVIHLLLKPKDYSWSPCLPYRHDIPRTMQNASIQNMHILNSIEFWTIE